MDARRQAQTIFITMKAQADLIDALIEEGALSLQAARPLVGNITVVTSAWVNAFPEGAELMSTILPRLFARLGLTQDGDT